MNFPQILPPNDITFFSTTSQLDDTLQGIRAFYNYLPKHGEFIGMHHHDFCEINIMIEGNAIHYIGNNTVPATKGDIFTIPIGVKHGYYPDGECIIFNLLLNQNYTFTLSQLDGFSYLFNAEPYMRGAVSSNMFPHFNSAYRKHIFPLLSRIEYLAQNNYTNQSEVLKNLIFFLMGEIIHCSKEKINDIHDQLPYSTRAMLNAVEYINNNYSQNVSFNALAASVNMSYTSFYNHFVEMFNMSPKQYLTEFRVKTASDLLLYTDMTVADIAAECGFYDSSHFIKKFKDQNGCSPFEYKKTIIKQQKSDN